MSQVKQWNWQNPDWPDWHFDASRLNAFENSFLLRSGQLFGALQHLASETKDQLKIDRLSDEAVKTSRIEGEYLDRASVYSAIRSQFGMSVGCRAGPAEAGIAELMVTCFNDFDADLTHDVLFHWHSLVCAGHSDLAVIGGYRTHEEAMQVVSGPFHKPNLHFEAPPSVVVAEEMTRFLDWYAEANLPALTKAGLAHLHFVCIHPFEDGNGRIARALSEKALAQAIGHPSQLALSRQIERRRKSYYDALEANNKSLDATNWLVWFAETVLAAQEYSISVIGHLIAKTRLLDRLHGQLNARQEKALIRMFDAGPEGFIGGLSAKNYISITGAAAATARRDLGDLVAKGALTRTGERRGTRYWLAP